MREQTTDSNSPVSDDELLFFYWRDGLSDSRQRDIAQALKRDPTLQQRLAALSADLGALQAPAEAEADDLYAARLLRQFDHTRSESQAPEASASKPDRARVWLWPVAAAVLLGVLVWRQPNPGPEDTDSPPVSAADPNPLQAESLNRRVAVELEQTSAQFGRLDQLDASAREDLLTTWRNQNELFALAAERNGDTQLARTLRAFAPLLDALNDADAQHRDVVLSQLQFEYTVMHTKLLHASSKSVRTEI